VNKHFELKIEKPALGGFGLGYHAGKAIFVPYTAVGDEIEAELLRERKDVAFARVKKYLKRGEGVVPNPCESFASSIPCGGCDWLDLEYSTQLKYKTGLIRELLQPLAPEADIREIQASPETLHYRNKAFMPVGEDENGLYFGIYARWSHKIVQHESCWLHPPIFDAIARRCLAIMGKTGVRAYNEARHTGKLRHIGFRCTRDQSGILLILVTRSGKLPFTKLLVKQLITEFPNIKGIIQNINRERGNVILGNEEKILYGEPWLHEDLMRLRFRVHYRSFWQVNTGTLELIIEHLRSQLVPQDVIYDLYAGIGVLGLTLAERVQQVLCIEENKAATSDGEENIRLNGIENAGFLCAKTEDALPALLDSGKTTMEQKPSAIILDPPRSGVRKEALDAIIRTSINRIYYISCSPITLHRDLKILLESGDYQLVFAQPFDMFPQTWHIECLAVLELKQSGESA